MPYYSFLFHDSAAADTYADVHEFTSAEVARTEAIRELSYLVTSRLPDGNRRVFAVTVTDEKGNDLWTARLDFTLEPAARAAN